MPLATKLPAPRAAIYARYSSDLQSPASIDDQVRICREECERRGWEVVAVYSDAAISGASALRPDYQRMQRDAREARFEVVVAESLDRLSRDQEDIAALYKRLRFADIMIVTLDDGEITDMHVGLKGTMNAMQLKVIADKTRRGLRGRVEAGRSGGGLAYGYSIVSGEPGVWQIEEAQAAIVRWIFEAYASGRSARAIARRLNEQGDPGPGGRAWGDTTVRGDASKGTGILNNEIYVGRRVWNCRRWLKDPDSGNRVSRPNNAAQRVVKEVPALRIVDQELWDRVKARQEDVRITMRRDATGNALNWAHRRSYLLSGLLACGVCGGGYTIVNARDYGCAAHRSKGTCSNDRTIRREELERRVLDGLKERLLAPELIEEAARAFQEEANRLASERSSQRAEDEAKLRGVQRKIRSVIRAVEDGLYQPAMKARMEELEVEKAAIERRLAEGAEPPIVRLHPGLAQVYRGMAGELEEVLADADMRHEAMAIIRSHIERITLTPRGAGLEVLLYGDLAQILQFCEAGERTSQRPGRGGPGRGLSVVAGGGFEPPTFRL